MKASTKHVDDIHDFIDLPSEEMSALVALYTLESSAGKAAYAVNETFGVWLSDLNLDLSLPYQNDLGIYSIERQVLRALTRKRLIMQEKLEDRVAWLKTGVRLYRLCPAVKQRICNWLTVCQIELPLLMQFNV